jgi:hypothetical protein
MGSDSTGATGFTSLDWNFIFKSAKRDALGSD